MITTYHRVELVAIGDNGKLDYFSFQYGVDIVKLKLAKSLIKSGSEYHGGMITEWAIYGDIDDAVLCHHAMSAFLGLEV